MTILIIQLLLLSVSGFAGIILNWLFILAIQRKNYHYQYSQKGPPPTVNKSILRQKSSISFQPSQIPLVPSLRSSLSIFDKYILALLVNDIFVCNFLLPLRLIDISQGLPCGFLCFLLSFLEKSTLIIELTIINFLLITSLVYFWKRRLLPRKVWYTLIVLLLPIFVGYFLTTLSYVDVDEYSTDDRSPTCKQTFMFIDATTQRILNIFCCFITYMIVMINFILIIKIKCAIKVFKATTLRNLAEVAISRKPASSSSFDQVVGDNNRRRSVYYFPSIAVEPSTVPSSTPPVQNPAKAVDYITYLTIIENSHTLIRSTLLILFIYLIVYIPYWFYELSNNTLSYKLKDVYFLSHIFKPIFYMLTNEKYRYHVWGILRCKTFRMLPNRT